ncbi:hypothetical protein RCS94_03655 [Orbaceae bacterium ac157xtp]
MTKFSNPKRYMPDYQVSISRIRAYMHEVKGQGYVKGDLYDELYSEYKKLTLIGTLKKQIFHFLEKHIWKFIITYCVGALALVAWFIGFVIF